MSEVKHREGCSFPRREAEAAQYRRTWLDHCEWCRGWGGFESYDDETGFTDFDPCIDCLEQGYCPRCGEGVIAESYWDSDHMAQCDSCGWLEGTSRGETEEYPCECIESQYDHYSYDDIPF